VQNAVWDVRFAASDLLAHAPVPFYLTLLQGGEHRIIHATTARASPSSTTPGLFSQTLANGTVLPASLNLPGALHVVHLLRLCCGIEQLPSCHV
jgi:hypothetical protein